MTMAMPEQHLRQRTQQVAGVPEDLRVGTEELALRHEGGPEPSDRASMRKASELRWWA